jgi:hypothetical protein
MAEKNRLSASRQMRPGGWAATGQKKCSFLQKTAFWPLTIGFARLLC